MMSDTEKDPVRTDDEEEAPRADEQMDTGCVERAEAPAEESAEVWKDKYLRALAELDNFRKRTERERDQVRRYAVEDLLRSILPVLDALEYAHAAEGDADAIRDGVRLALDDAMRILGDTGLARIDGVDEPFDPRFQEAVGVLPDEERAAATVLQVERTGYRLHDRVLRPSRVIISIRPPREEAQEEGD